MYRYACIYEMAFGNTVNTNQDKWPQKRNQFIGKGTKQSVDGDNVRSVSYFAANAEY